MLSLECLVRSVCLHWFVPLCLHTVTDLPGWKEMCVSQYFFLIFALFFFFTTKLLMFANLTLLRSLLTVASQSWKTS